MTRGIYRIGSRDLTMYVGQSTNVEYRLGEHYRELQKGLLLGPSQEGLYLQHEEVIRT